MRALVHRVRANPLHRADGPKAAPHPLARRSCQTFGLTKAMAPQSKRGKARRLTVALVAVVIAGGGVAVLADHLLTSTSTHSLDEALIATFKQQRSTFNRLRQMIAEDSDLQSVSLSEAQPKHLITTRPDRIADYRALMKSLGFKDAVIRASEDRSTVEIQVSSEGFVTHNSQKGYLFLEKLGRDPPVVELDTMTNAGRGSGLRQLDGGWYLYFEGY